MREIKFRGKRIDNGEWVYGYYYEKAVPLQCFDEGKEEKPKGFIIFPGFADWNMPRPMYEAEVIPETVGEYTGLKDKTDKEIYEGDIIKIVLKGKYIDDDEEQYFLEEEQIYIGEVYYDNGYCVKTKKYCPSLTHLLKKSLEKIGNKFQNPELLSN